MTPFPAASPSHRAAFGPDAEAAALLSAAVARVNLPSALALGEHVWDELQARVGAISPFDSWSWHHAWARTATIEDLRAVTVLVAREPSGNASALLPMRSTVARMGAEWAVALVLSPGDIGCPDQRDALIASDHAADQIAAELDRMSWDTIVLDNLRNDAAGAERLAAALARLGHRLERKDSVQLCPYIALPESWDMYLGGLSPTRRQAVRRKERRLEREFTITQTDHDFSDLHAGWFWLSSLHDERWQGRTAFSPGVATLHRHFAEELARRGQLWLSTLFVNGEAAAAWYGFAAGDTVSFYQSGRAERFESESVGQILMGRMIRRAIERGYRRFDFLRGDEPYKMSWTGEQRATAEVRVFRRGWRGERLRHWLRATRLARRGRARVAAAIRGVRGGT